MPFIVSLKRGGKGYTKVAFAQSHDSNFFSYILKSTFTTETWQFRKQKASDIFSANTFYLICDIPLSNLPNIVWGCVFATFLDVEDAEKTDVT